MFIHRSYPRSFRTMMSDIKKSNGTAKIVKTDLTYPYSQDLKTLLYQWFPNSTPETIRQLKKVLLTAPHSTKNVTNDDVINTHKTFNDQLVSTDKGKFPMTIMDAIANGTYDPRLDSLKYHFTDWDDPIVVDDNGNSKFRVAPRTDVKVYSENIFPKIQNRFNIKDTKSPEYRYLLALGINPGDIMSLDANKLDTQQVLMYPDFKARKWRKYPIELFNNFGQNTNDTLRTMTGEALEGFWSLPKSVQEALGLRQGNAYTYYFTDETGSNHGGNEIYVQSPEQILTTPTGARRGAHQGHELAGHHLFDLLRNVYYGKDRKKIGKLDLNALSYPMINAMYKIYYDKYGGDQDQLAGDMGKLYFNSRGNDKSIYNGGEIKSLLDLLNMSNIAGVTSSLGEDSIYEPENFKLKNNIQNAAAHDSNYYTRDQSPYTLLANEGFATTLGAMSPDGKAREALTSKTLKPFGEAAEEMGKQYVDYRKDNPDD